MLCALQLLRLRPHRRVGLRAMGTYTKGGVVKTRYSRLRLQSEFPEFEFVFPYAWQLSA